jgi:hypothetical protein
VGEPTRRGRIRTKIVSVLLLLIVSANRTEHDGGPGNGRTIGIMSALSVIPEVLDEVAQLIRALTNS